MPNRNSDDGIVDKLSKRKSIGYKEIECWGEKYSIDRCIEAPECEKCCCCVQAKICKKKYDNIKKSINQKDKVERKADKGEKNEDNAESVSINLSEDFVDLTSEKNLEQSEETKPITSLSTEAKNFKFEDTSSRPNVSKANEERKASNGRKPSRLFPKDYVQSPSKPIRDILESKQETVKKKFLATSPFEKFSKAASKVNTVNLLSGHRLEYVPKSKK